MSGHPFLIAQAPESEKLGDGCAVMWVQSTFWSSKLRWVAHMPLSAGAKLGSFETTALIGKDGSVEQFSNRFSRDARAIAAFEHTNIWHLYGGGPIRLVMEYSEGADLHADPAMIYRRRRHNGA